MTISKEYNFINVKSVQYMTDTNNKNICKSIKAKQIARTLYALSVFKNKGMTTLDLSCSWAFRLSAYIHTLRTDYGLNIETIRESHSDGWHARYVLNTPLRIISVNGREVSSHYNQA